MNKIIKGSLKNTFCSRRKEQRFGWLSVLLAITANILIFMSISWVNHTPASHSSETYAAIEVFKPQLIPENIPPITESMPVIVERKFQPKPEPMKLILSKETLVRPQLIEWMPDSLMKKPGVGIDISLTKLPSPDSINAADVSDALALNQVDQPPRRISGTLPAYPIWARAKKAEGMATLRFVVDIDGKVRNIEVYGVQGDERFATNAAKAVEKWQFEPAINRGAPVPVWCLQKIQFQFTD
ncbi:MAG: TonB family protein [Phycisphaerae bacterium]|nr:TonB family protein [Phycisphaerae bacterium]